MTASTPLKTNLTHEDWMRHALRLSARELGQTWPNPAVGCVIVKDGLLRAQGWTQKSGRPHAETHALSQCDASGATVYVTLEPCAHHGKTPPCAQALIDAKVAEVVIACTDPDPRVSGQGIQMLQAANIKVVTGILEFEAQKSHLGFFSRLKKNRPMITIKVATDPAGRYLAGNGQTQWLSSEQTKNVTHRLRADYDAILTGSGTILADNPLLTVRLNGLPSPIRIVLDRRGRLPADHPFLKTHSDDQPMWILQDSLSDTLKKLAQKGITRLWVEAGPTLTKALIDANLWDEFYWFQSPTQLDSNAPSFGLEDFFKQQKIYAAQLHADKIHHFVNSTVTGT